MTESKRPRTPTPMARRTGALGCVLLFVLCAVALAAAPGIATAAPTAPSWQPGGAGLALIALQQAELTASGGAVGDNFGYSVALDGDTAVVGADTKTVGGNTHAGAAYVFTRTGTTWTQQGSKLTAADSAASDQFGYVVAVDGDTALVGADTKTVGGNNFAGAAYVFTRTGTTWSQQGKLTANDSALADIFGCSVALDGDTALVGAEGKTVGGHAMAGAAYVFTRTGTTWSQQTELTASDAAAANVFGYSVALDGTTALIGAPWKSANAGVVYVFTGSGATWTEEGKMTPSDPAGSDHFGSSLALDGTKALIGTPGKIVSYARTGAVYVFTMHTSVRDGVSWTQEARVAASDGASGDLFGCSVALSGTTCLVGAYQAVAAGPGAAYVEVLKPAPSLTLKAKPQSVKVGMPVTVSGVVKNPVAGITQVQIWRKVGSKMTRLKRETITKSGAFKWTMRPGKAGKWDLVATYKVNRITFSSRAVKVKVQA